MTKKEWRTSTDLIAMLKPLLGEASDRKVRLFGCVCCRAVWPLLIDERSRRAVTFAEDSIDAPPNVHEEQEVLEAACQASDELEELCVSGPNLAEHERRWNAAAMADRLLCHPLSAYINGIALGAIYQSGNIAWALRDIFGNPFRPVSLDSAWLTSDVLALARGIYEERAFDRMPILADALQDAGCTNEDILSHCRDAKQVHVRGCWVVDLILEKQ